MRAITTTLSVLALGAVAVVGGNRTESSQIPMTTASAHAAATRSTVMLRRTRQGKILVDSRGRTLYLFEKDRADRRTCSGGCLQFWPAMTATATPHAGGGVSAAKLGLIRGPGRRRQVTYAHHPLYYFSGDHRAGDTAGQGLNAFGAKWYVVSAGGKAVDDD